MPIVNEFTDAKLFDNFKWLENFVGDLKDPKAEYYGAFYPFAREADGTRRFGAPLFAQDMAKAFTAPRRAWTGELQIDDMPAEALGIIGSMNLGGAAAAPVGEGIVGATMRRGAAKPKMTRAEHKAKDDAAFAAKEAKGIANLAAARESGVGVPTVADPRRLYSPGVYGDPREVAALAETKVAPESRWLKQLFGVNRGDLAALGSREDNMAPRIRFAKNPRGSAAAEQVTVPQNRQRILDQLAEAKTGAPKLWEGMSGWYVMDPVYKRLKELVADPVSEYRNFNEIMGMMSPNSDVIDEINRGTAARYLINQGRFDDFKNLGGIKVSARTNNYPADMRFLKGHKAHGTSHALPVEMWLARGRRFNTDKPKVISYIDASGVPETGFQNKFPVGDAHLARGVGLADVRNNKTPGEAWDLPEATSIQPWFRGIANEVGVEAVPGQAIGWGLWSPYTGVTSPIGAPKLELFANEIARTAAATGMRPEEVRDLVLAGKMYVGGPVTLPMDGTVSRAAYGKGLVGGIEQIETSGPGIAGRKPKK